MLTKKELKEHFTYNEETGLLTRIKVGKFVSKNLIGTSGNKNKHGYIRVNFKMVSYKVHRLVFLYMTGSMPDQVDHINHNRSDNRWCNLRSVSNLENSKNISMLERNTSGFTGVDWNKDAKKWRARITINGVRKLIGYFDSKPLAILARKNANKKHNYHPNHGK